MKRQAADLLTRGDDPRDEMQNAINEAGGMSRQPLSAEGAA
jgi:hypothetical protein